MFSEFLSNVVVGQGFLNLFVNLFVLTLVTGVLLLVSGKWTSPARSYLLMGIIISYVLIIGLNLAFFNQPDKRYSIVSFTLPAIDDELEQLLLLPDENISSDNLTLNSDTNMPIETTGMYNPASLSRLIVSGATIAGLIWLGGSMVFIIRLTGKLIHLERFKRRLTRVRDNRIQALLEKVKTRLDFKEPPSLYSSAEIESPMTIGIFHPIIVMLEKILNVTSREEYLCILGHESGHIKHFDNLTGLLQRIFIALNWPNPLAYIISARYSLTREDVCDYYAVQMIDDRSRYTRCLVNLAEKNCLISSFTPSVGLVGCKNSLAQRLNRILGKDQTMNMKLTSAVSSWTVSCFS